MEKFLPNKSINGKDRIGDFHYVSAIGSPSFLLCFTRTCISILVYQDANFRTNPKHSHDNAVKLICECLKRTIDKRLILELYLIFFFRNACWCWFLGAYDKDASEDPSIVRSRTWFIIKHANFSKTWKSKLQAEIALSTTKDENASISTTSKEATPIKNYFESCMKWWMLKTAINQWSASF